MCGTEVAVQKKFCNCKGTMEYVHQQCIEQWLSSKADELLRLESLNLLWCKKKPDLLRCSVCQFAYRYRVRHKSNSWIPI